MTRRCSLKIQTFAGITLFVCRNRYRTYDGVGFVTGGTFFGTLCPTQDETMSRTKIPLADRLPPMQGEAPGSDE